MRSRKVQKFNQTLQDKVEEFEAKFGISSSISVPKVENTFRIPSFNPSQLEKLKPLKFRLWCEQVLPHVLVRDVRFWSSPISIQAGSVSINFWIPIGVKQKSEMAFEIQNNVPKQAIQIMNEYVYNSIDRFVAELNKAYESAITQFINDWRKCLRDYLRRIEVAKTVTEPAALKKIDDLVKEINGLYKEVGNLMTQD